MLASDRRDAVDGLIVLISDGRALESDAEAAIAAANRARAYKLEIHVVGLGREVDAPTLRAVAGSPERYRRVEDAAGALAVLDQLGRDMLARMMAGGQVSLAVGITAMLLALLLGAAQFIQLRAGLVQAQADVLYLFIKVGEI